MTTRGRVKLLAVCVLAGTLINVTVAWGCAIWSNPEFTNYRVLTDAESQAIWDRHAPRDWAQPLSRFDHAVRDLSFGVSHNMVYASDGRHGIVEVQTGWPLNTVQSAGLFEEDSRLAPFHALKWPMDAKHLGMHAGTWLPYAPLWPGVIINTVFYASIIWLLLRSPVELRGRLRQWRGVCERCAYPVGKSPVCTECGAMISRRAKLKDAT